MEDKIVSLVLIPQSLHCLESPLNFLDFIEDEYCALFWFYPEACDFPLLLNPDAVLQYGLIRRHIVGWNFQIFHNLVSQCSLSCLPGSRENLYETPWF